MAVLDAKLGSSPWPFQVIAKPVGSACNLACDYCYYRDKAAVLGTTDDRPALRMSDATLERFVRDYLSSQPGDAVVFTWQGGEPTLAGLGFYQRVVELQKHYAAGRRVTNLLQTNGTRLDDAWGEFLARERFAVGISVDGPRALHDAFRRDREGRRSAAGVERGLKILRRHGVPFHTITVVQRENVAQPREVYAYLKAAGATRMHFIPLVERRPTPRDAARGLVHAMPRGVRGPLVLRSLADHEVTRACPTPGQFGRFLVTLFNIWWRSDVGRIVVPTFESALAAWVDGVASQCPFEERCGRVLALEHNGDVFACDHFVYPEFRLGNLHATPLAHLGRGVEASRFGQAKADLPRVCTECPVAFACRGDCPKHRFVITAPEEPGLSYLCPAYQRFFAHIAPKMERMAEQVRAGRSPAEARRALGR